MFKTFNGLQKWILATVLSGFSLMGCGLGGDPFVRAIEDLRAEACAFNVALARNHPTFLLAAWPSFSSSVASAPSRQVRFSALVGSVTTNNIHLFLERGILPFGKKILVEVRLPGEQGRGASPDTQRFTFDMAPTNPVQQYWAGKRVECIADLQPKLPNSGPPSAYDFIYLDLELTNIREAQARTPPPVQPSQPSQEKSTGMFE